MPPIIKPSLKAENIVLKPDRVEFDAYGQETAPSLKYTRQI